MHSQDHGKMAYPHFAIMTAISFLIMFGFMYAMVDRWANISIPT